MVNFDRRLNMTTGTSQLRWLATKYYRHQNQKNIIRHRNPPTTRLRVCQQPPEQPGDVILGDMAL
jgi:hypothetical protein